MTPAQLKDVVHGRSPVTEAHIDGVLATIRKVVLAAPTPAAALRRLYDHASQEAERIAEDRGVAAEKIRSAGVRTGDRQAELLELARIHG